MVSKLVSQGVSSPHIVRGGSEVKQKASLYSLVLIAPFHAKYFLCISSLNLCFLSQVYKTEWRGAGEDRTVSRACG